MPRYVVLEHETPAGYARPRHWDLMLETGGALRTWALDEPPERVRSGQGEHSVQGELLRDHRLAYLDYEGPVSGDRGTVVRWDTGEYESEVGAAVMRRGGVIACVGTHWSGRIELIPGQPHWTFRRLSD